MVRDGRSSLDRLAAVTPVAWLNPKLFLPSSVWFNRLQLTIHAGVREVQGIRDCSHRLDTDEVTGLWSVGDRHPVFGTEADLHEGLFRTDVENSIARPITFKVRIYVIKFNRFHVKG